MKNRPWIWVLLANIIFISCTITLVTIAIRHPQAEVPIVHEQQAEH